MQAPAHRPHFLLFWIALLLLAMTGVLRWASNLASGAPAPERDAARSAPALPPPPVPFAKELPFLDAHGLPFAPAEADAPLAEEQLEMPGRGLEQPPASNHGPQGLANLAADAGAAQPIEPAQAPGVEREVLDAPRRPQHRLIARADDSGADDPRIDPARILEAPAPMSILLPAAPAAEPPSGHESKAAPPPTRREILVIPITPEDFFAVVLEDSLDPPADDEEEPQVVADEQEAETGASGEARSGGEREARLRELTAAARAKARASGQLTEEDLALILDAIQERGGRQALKGFILRLQPDQLAVLIERLLRASA